MELSPEVLALRYAARGWAVLPVHTPLPAGGCSCEQDCGTSAGKHPRTRHGLHEASCDSEQVARWWRRWPNANVGIRTGRESGLVVLDVDARHDGEASLETLEATYDRLPPTLAAHSGGGGRHLYFHYPQHYSQQHQQGQHPKRRIRSSAGLRGYSGLDVRGDGGYIVAPPSLHRSGERYTWEEPLRPLAVLPEWLYDLLTSPSRPVYPAPPITRLAPSGEVEQFWLQEALARARPGTRNVTGYWLACHLRDAGVSRQAAEPILLRYAAQVSAGDHPYHAREALASLRSAYRSPAQDHAAAPPGT